MGTEAYLGRPPPSVVEWIKDHRGPKLDNPLCFTAVDAGATIVFNKVGSPASARIVTSTNGQNWTNYAFNAVVTLANVGDKVYFRAEDENDISFYKDYQNYYKFATTAEKKIAASGNIQTLMKADGSRLDISGKKYCYSYMFSGCSSLTTAPELPATALAIDCYYYMFKDCSSLTAAPALPATTLIDWCYERMFNGCSRLASIDVSFTAWNPANATDSWVMGVPASGTFTCPSTLPNTPRNVSHIPSGWTKVDK